MHRIEKDEKSFYQNLVQSAKAIGFKHNKRGKPKISDLEIYIYKNINRVEPQPQKPKRGYNSMYMNELFYLAVENGFINNRAGKQSEKTLVDFLTSRNVSLPENQIVIHQHRRKLSDCKTYYDRLLFEAKELGYKQGKLGKPSLKALENYLQIG